MRYRKATLEDQKAIAVLHARSGRVRDCLYVWSQIGHLTCRVREAANIRECNDSRSQQEG